MEKRWIIAALAIVAAATPTVSHAQLATSPWPMFQHDLAHTGRSQFSTSSNPGTLKWKFATGSSFLGSSPAVGADGTIYIGSEGGNLYAVNPNGTEKWTFATWPIDFSSPAIGADGTIYVGSENGFLYAVKPTGTEKWVFSTGGGSVADSSPAIGTDGTIYIDAFAVNPNGTQKWVGGGAVPLPRYPPTSPAVGADGTIYSAAANGGLIAINPTGTEKWENALITAPCGEVIPQTSSPAIGADGTIYIGEYCTNLPGSLFYSVTPDGGGFNWAADAGNTESAPAIGTDRTIYVSGAFGDLYAITPRGSQKWALATSDGEFSSPAIGADGTIYIGSNTNKLYAINPNGTQKWAFTTSGAVDSSPAIGADGTIYIGDRDGNLYAVGAAPSPTATATSTATATASATTKATPTASQTVTGTPTSTQTASPTATPTPTVPGRIKVKESLTVKAKPNKRKTGRIVVENTGKGPLMVDVEPSSLSQPFTETGGGSGIFIAPKGSHDVKIEYSPTGTEPETTQVTITSNDPTHPSPIVVQITGKK
jgi:outer membrane protein assembly factor BamB